MIERIICAGFGGQGTIALGRILAYCAMVEDKYTTWMPSYGAEQRGGTAHSMIVISDSFIASPIVTNPDTCIIMNKPSLDKFMPKVKDGGLIILNSSLADIDSKKGNLSFVKIPMTEIATKLGNIKTANIVGLGAYIAKRHLVSKESAILALKHFFGEGKKELISLNQKAIEEGMKWITKK